MDDQQIPNEPTTTSIYRQSGPSPFKSTRATMYAKPPTQGYPGREGLQIRGLPESHGQSKATTTVQTT